MDSPPEIHHFAAPTEGGRGAHLEMLLVLVYHVERGIEVILLDTIAYLWKEKGQCCIHHPKTHDVSDYFSFKYKSRSLRRQV